MSSEDKILYSLPSILISVPPYLLTSTRSPFLTSNGIFFPSSLVLPVPRAMMMPSCGFSLAVSGMMMPPFLVSFSSTGSTRMRSPIGLMFSAIVCFPCCWFVNRDQLPPHPRWEKLFLLVHNFRVNHAFVLLFVVGLRLAAFRLRLRAGLSSFSLRLCRSRLVKLGGNRLPDFVQLFARCFQGRGVRAFERFLHVRNGLLYLGLVVAGNLVGVVLEHLFGAIHRAVRLVARLD